MSIFRPFRALRPDPALAGRIAALPYDVMNEEEARALTAENPYSFLHISRAEVDLPEGTDPYSDEVYAKAAENLRSFEEKGYLLRDKDASFYILQQNMGGRVQTGLVGCASIDDYINNVIKKHEKTRYEKEADRIRHVSTCMANTGAIFLTYRGRSSISAVIQKWKQTHTPVYDFTMDGGVRTLLWVVDDANVCLQLSTAFRDEVDSLYIADGHHRCASAAHVGMELRRKNPSYTGYEEFNRFLAVAFPSDELQIMDYNRVVRTPEGMTKEELFQGINKNFDIECQLQLHPCRPEAPRTFGMYYDGSWYKLTARPDTYPPDDPVDSLDVSILQNNLIAPVLGIEDPRKDSRIDFVGGIRGLEELERRATSDMNLAFAMYPTSLDQLIAIADAHELMPPKSTWFEPKLPSGLFIHDLSE